MTTRHDPSSPAANLTCWLLAGSLLVSLSGRALGEDAPAKEPAPAAESTPPAATTPSPAPETTPPADKPVEETPAKSKKSPLDLELLRTLGVKPETGKGGDENPIERAVQRMRTVQQRLEEGDPGEETRAAQANVVDDIQALIDLLKQQQQNPQKPPPPQQGGEPPPPRDPKSGAQNQPQPQNTGKTQPKTGAQQQPSQRSEDKSADSTDRVDQGKPKEADAEPPPDWSQDVWGNLPPSVRQQLLNQFSEKFLPKYDELVRKYYEALAEREKKGNR